MSDLRGIVESLMLSKALQNFLTQCGISPPITIVTFSRYIGWGCGKLTLKLSGSPFNSLLENSFSSSSLAVIIVRSLNAARFLVFVAIPNHMEPIPDLLSCPTMVLRRIDDLSSGADSLGDEQFVNVHIRHVEEVKTIFKPGYVLGEV